MPKLIVTEKGSEKRQTFEFSHEGVSIGRSDENGLKLPSSAVSRKHADIVVTGTDCFLVDLGSGNGTYLNGVKVGANQKNILRHGDIIAIENFNLNFNMIDEMLASSFNEITDSDIIEVKLLKKVLKAIDKERIPSIEVLNGNFVGKKFFFAEDVDEMSIGRDENADFQVEEYVISRNHVRITRTDNGFVIKDLESKNGTYVNNHRIVNSELHDGDRIALGTIVFIFRDPNEVKMEEISVRAKKAPRSKARTRPRELIEESEESLRLEDYTGGSSGMEEFEAVPDTTSDDCYPIPQGRKERIKL